MALLRRFIQPYNPDDEETRRLLAEPVVTSQPHQMRLLRSPSTTPEPLPHPALTYPTAATVPEPAYTPVVNAGPAPVTTIGPHGRPQLIRGLENSVEGQRGLRGELQSYQPQKRRGFKDFAVDALVNFVRGGLPGVALGAVHRVADPEFEDRAWQQQQLQRTDQNIDQLLQEQRAGLSDRLLNSQVLENEAQAEAATTRAHQLTRPATRRVAQSDGTVIQEERDPATGEWSVSMRQGAAGLEPVVLMRPKPERLVTVQTPDGPLTVPHTTALQYYGQIGARNDAREGQYASAQDELEQLTADEASAGEAKNAAYTLADQAKAYLSKLIATPTASKEEIDQARDQVRETDRAANEANTFYRSFGPKKAAAKSRGTRYAPPQLTRSSGLAPDVEARIREAAIAAGLNPDTAVERARKRQ